MKFEEALAEMREGKVVLDYEKSRYRLIVVMYESEPDEIIQNYCPYNPIDSRWEEAMEFIMLQILGDWTLETVFTEKIMDDWKLAEKALEKWRLAEKERED